MPGRELKVFVGYDSREDVAWQVCRATLNRLSPGVPVYPLRIGTLRELGLYTRPADVGASTEFSLTRFLTPYLAASEGWSLFVDCDFVFTTDVRDALAHVDPDKAIHVVKHDYVPRSAKKMDDQVQTSYPRKNWSSFVLFNGSHAAVRKLTPEMVNTSSPAHLHRFAWLHDDEIGELPASWNHLVGEYRMPAQVPAAIHYTNGGPWFDTHQDVDYADLWIAERERLGQ